MKKLLFLLPVLLVLLLSLLWIRSQKQGSVSIKASSSDEKVSIQRVAYGNIPRLVTELSIALPEKSLKINFVPDVQTGFQTTAGESAEYNFSSDWLVGKDGLEIRIHVNPNESSKLSESVINGLVYQHVIFQLLSYKQSSDAKISAKMLIPNDLYTTTLQRFLFMKDFISIKLL